MTPATRDNIDAVMHRRGISPDVWIAPTLAGNWTPYGVQYNAPGYRLDVQNRVWLRGLYGVLPTIGTSTQVPPSTMFVLAAPYQPLNENVLSTIGYTGTVYTLVRIEVLANGTVQFLAQEAGTSVVWISLDSISFAVN